MPIPPEGMYDPAVIPVERPTIADGTWRGIPEPDGTLAGINASVAATKELIETLLGLRGEEGTFGRYLDDILGKYPTKHNVVEFAAYAACGGIHYSGGPTGGSDIGAAWQTVTIPNTLTIDPPLRVTPDLGSSTLAVKYPSIYYLTVTGSFGHNSSNSGRTTSLRLYDTLNSAGLGNFQIGIGRNVEVTAFTIAVPMDVTVGSDVPIAVQIGNGDTLSSVEWLSFIYSLHSIGDYRGPT